MGAFAKALPMPALSVTKALRPDLKLRLALRVAALAALCFLAAAGYILMDAAHTARMRTDWVAEVAAKDLALQQDQDQWIKGVPSMFPDLARVAPALMAPGLCIAYRTQTGQTLQRLCSGDAPGEGAPGLFAYLYERLFDADRESAHPVILHDEAHGEVVASTARQSLIDDSWHQVSRLAAVMASTLLALCFLVYAALADALRPTRAIRTGLERLAAGDLSARLAPFDLAELSAIGNVFNHLAARLETTLAERNALTQRLIAVQDEERLHLARELHDEFGQCLAAISAVAASAGHTARLDCPALVPECQSIAGTAARMMDALRGALLRLRPPEIDELGLAASLEGLVAGWNRNGGATRFAIQLTGQFDTLPPAFAADLYRVAQEAITNAAKHAQASRVTLRLCMPEEGSEEETQIELAVGDDGRGADAQAKSGLGLLGMRERVAALGGQLVLQDARPHGLTLRAHIPVPRRITPRHVEKAVA
jgi:signal transduction histidine kinase